MNRGMAQGNVHTCVLVQLYTHVSFRRELEPRDGISADNRAHVDTASPSPYAATITIHGRIHGRILVLFYGAPAVQLTVILV
jgi:hypothetical protein